MLEITEKVELKPLEFAIELLGGVSEMARLLSVNPSAIGNWRRRGRVPPDRCMQIEMHTRGKVKRKALRPDLFGGFTNLRKFQRQPSER